MGKPAVALLLGVWGRRYIERFLELSLRSLLAPGNLPALAVDFECTFVFLTVRGDDEALVREHPMFPRLSRHCAIRFVDIRDLIFAGNYSTTLTLAYERGMRATGAAMLETTFIYLVSDYVMADGSFAGLLPYLRRGVRGITSGNFQVVEEEVRDALLLRRSPVDGTLTIPPRELVRLGLRHLHPISVGSTVTQTEVHNGHANRLFWPCGSDALVGRFYLRHMLCIKPERADFKIGASCDYSFIPEMCPSGNVVALADSDEYCVIELSPAAHENHFLAPGPLNRRALARDLSGWTTAEHRRNAATATVLHGGDLDEEIARAVVASGRWVDELEPLLAPAPQPFSGHPYWKGAVSDGVGVLGELQQQVFGHPPRVSRWHHRWQDYRAVMAHLEETARGAKPTLAIHTAPNPCSFWLTRHHARHTTFLPKEVLVREGAGEGAPVEVAYLFLASGECADLRRAIDQVTSRLAPGGQIVVHILDDGGGVNLFAIAASLARHVHGSRLAVARTTYARSRFRARADGVHRRLVGEHARGRTLSTLALGSLQCAYRLDNALVDVPLFGTSRRASSCTIVLEMGRGP